MRVLIKENVRELRASTTSSPGGYAKPKKGSNRLGKAKDQTKTLRS